MQESLPVLLFISVSNPELREKRKGAMKNKKILVAALILILVGTACSFSTGLTVPNLFNSNQPTPAISLNLSPSLVPQVNKVTAGPPAPTATTGVLPQFQDINLDERDQLLTELYNQVSPAVVYIIITTADGGASGSGFVYDTNGDIVTNYHVVEGADTLEVDFPSGFKSWAKVIGTDLDSDLAVVKVDNLPSDPITPVAIGDSDQVRVGETVVAIGNPFGYTGTMTIGIVSAKGRTLESMRPADSGQSFTAGDLIQTDAAINPGNSGGPLLDLKGEVIGVNRAIQTVSTTAGGEPTSSGIGFAVPSNIVRRVVPSLIANGAYDYPYLGITSQSDLTLDMIQELKLPQQTGAYVNDVAPGGPADKAGIRGGTVETSYASLYAGGDLIIAVDGQPVQSFGDMLSYLIYNKSPGDQVTMTVIRNNQQKEVTITLGRRP